MSMRREQQTLAPPNQRPDFAAHEVGDRKSVVNGYGIEQLRTAKNLNLPLGMGDRLVLKVPSLRLSRVHCLNIMPSPRRQQACGIFK